MGLVNPHRTPNGDGQVNNLRFGVCRPAGLANSVVRLRHIAWNPACPDKSGIRRDGVCPTTFIELGFRGDCSTQPTGQWTHELMNPIQE